VLRTGFKEPTRCRATDRMHIDNQFEPQLGFWPVVPVPKLVAWRSDLQGHNLAKIPTIGDISHPMSRNILVADVGMRGRACERARRRTLHSFICTVLSTGSPSACART
jgi:hypothetical protein